MSETTLAMAWATHIVVAALYGVVGTKLARRPVQGASAIAHRGFVAFWFALMGNEVVGAMRSGLYILDLLTVPVYSVLTQAGILLVVAALWGLLAYLLYLYTGSARSLRPLTIGYALFFIAIQLLVLSSGPVEALTDDGWSVERVPDADFPEWVGLLFLIFLIGPQFAAAVAFLSLYPRVEDRTQRYRIALVGGSIMVWFGSVLLVSLTGEAGTGLRESVQWQLGSRLLGVLAAAIILMAYLPPAWIQARGIRSINDET